MGGIERSCHRGPVRVNIPHRPPYIIDDSRMHDSGIRDI
jgi:hypothetical protein